MWPVIFLGLKFVPVICWGRPKISSNENPCSNLCRVPPPWVRNTTKKLLLLDTLVKFPSVTARSGNSAPGLSSWSTQLILKWEKMTKSSDKNNDHSLGTL